MRRNYIILNTIGLTLVFSLVHFSIASATTYVTPGGDSSGNGSVPTCSTSYTSIHEPSCGLGGGGKSWRVYKITDAVIKAVANRDKYTGNSDSRKTALNNAILNALDSGATWSINNKGHGGNSILSTVKKCAKTNPAASVIIILGLNQVAVTKQSGNFYVSFSQQKKNNNCRKNRGCYYNWNNDGFIDLATLQGGKFANGAIVKNKLASALYKKAKAIEPGLPAYKSVGAFCSTPEDVDEEFSMTAYAMDTSGNLLLGGGKIDESESVSSGEAATVENIDLSNMGYNFVRWRDQNVATSSLTLKLTSDLDVFAQYQPIAKTSTLSVNVKNDSTPAYNSYAEEVYAKPEDNMTFKIDYAPNAQGACNMEPEAIKIGNGSIIMNDYNEYIRTLFDKKRGSYAAWNNALVVTGDDNFTPSVDRLSYTACDTTAQSNTNQYQVKKERAGQEVTEKAQTEQNSNGTTPSKVQFVTLANNGSNVMTGNILTGLTDSATIKVPYNFTNTTNIIGLGENSNVVYAGETTTVSFNIATHTRTNNTLNGTYATIAENAKWRIGVSTSRGGTYQWSEITSGSLNSSRNLNSTIPDTDIASLESKDLSVNIPDVRAGSEVCFKSAVFPNSSVTDLQMDSAYPGASWAESEEACFIVAKRPSLQIWGGNVFSSGSIETGLAIKNNLAGISGAEYNPSQGHGPFVFGSWSELGVISMGNVAGFTSGASTGYAGLNDKVLTPNPFTNNPLGSTPGGGNTDNFVNLSNLTFANTSDGINRVTGTGDINNARSISDDHSLLESFVSSFSTEEATAVTLDNNAIVSIAPDAQDDGVVQYRNDAGDLEVGAITLGPNKVKVISANNIKVSGDIFYNSGDEGFISLLRVPKVLIYASDTISINCDVTHLDAVLVASNVITCGDSLANETESLNNLNVRAQANINEAKNSKQLYINGAVITNNLIANRTYGAATGSNSIVPAEIINFDPTLYLWAGSNAGIGDNGSTINADLEITYSHELAPRR